MQEPIDRYFAAHGLVPKVVMRFDNSEFVRSMVRAGLGISMLPLWIVDRDVKERRLSMIRQTEPPLYSKIALVRRKSSYVPLPVQAFIDTARNVDLKHVPLLTRPH
jgi:DNA-binding transcriptional LysR family regulator